MNIKTKKIIGIVAVIFIVINLFVFGTISYLNKINKKQNEFILGTIEPQILQDYDEENNIKENIKIKNIGNSPIYVRATIVYYFVNSNNQIIKDLPTLDADYSIIFSSSDNWIKSKDGYYYYKLVLNPDEKTDNLIDKYIDINNDINKKVMIDVVVQAIQTYPSSAVEDAWGVNVVDNKISIE